MSIGVHRSGPRPVPTSGLLGPGSAGKRLKITGFGVQSLGTPTRRGCTLGGNFKFVEGLKSVILGIWHTPGAPETLPRSWGASPPTFCKGLRARPLARSLASPLCCWGPFCSFRFGSGPEDSPQTAFAFFIAPFFELDPLEGVPGPTSPAKHVQTQMLNFNFYFAG
jgi:hypothetical protein